MIRVLFFTAVAGMLLWCPETLAGGEEALVHLAGVRVVGPGSGLNGTELQAFHQRSGTTLALLVRAPNDQKIVELDDAKCSVVEFSDDRDHSLLDGIDWGGFPQISDDGRFALIEVSSRARPSAGASRLLVRGSVHLRVAAAERTERIESLTLSVGATMHVLQEPVQVMKVEEGDGGLTLVLQVSRQFSDAVKDIRFYSAEGNAVNIWSRGSLSFGNATQLEFSLETDRIPEALECDVWQGLDTLTLPFEIDSGLGL